MAIVKASVGGQRGSGGDRTVSVEVNAISDVIIAVCTALDSNTSNIGVSSILRNGQNFTKSVEYGGSGGTGAPARISIWYLTSPSVGTYDAVADFNSFINESTMTCYVLTGADADALINGSDGDTANGVPPAMSITTTADSCFLIGGLVSEGAISAVGIGQTEDGDYTDQSYENTSVSSEAGGVAGAQAHSYTAPSNEYAQAVVAIKPAAAASTPSVTTNSASEIADTYATGNGEVTSDGGDTITERGFCWSESANPTTTDSTVIVSGTTGVYSGSITGLTAGTTYHYRAYATNGEGTSYGNDTQFTTSETADISEYIITIGGIDRTDNVINQSIVVEDVVNDKANICSFRLIDRNNSGAPTTDDEVIIELSDTTKLFGGYITGIRLDKKNTGTIEYAISCVDYTYILDRFLVHRSYQDNTDAEIIDDFVTRYCVGLGITTTNVIEGVTIDSIKFNYIQISQAMRRISELTNRNWYIDYDKDIHYFPLTTNPAPFNITSTNALYKNLVIKKDTTQLKNRVYVRGGTKLSDPTTYSVKGDGVAKQFPLPDKPHDVSVTVNGSAKSLGIKNVDLTGYDWYLNFQEKYIEQDTGGTTLSTSDTLAVTYTYDIPILAAVEDTASILANGVKEFAIFDKSIDTTQAARDRATAELTDYANDIIDGSFITYTPGFRSGQYININLPAYGINDDYMVQKVVARSMGAGTFYYQISIASSKTLGIIKFLIGLLEANKNLIELSDDEVVDELLQAQDSLLSDSLTDALTIDSTGPYFTWCTDSLDDAPITRARWELFQWGV